MTNFATIRKSVKKMQSINAMLQDGTLNSVTKKERLVLSRERNKMDRVLGGIEQLNRLPAAIFMVDIMHEHIALKEAKKLNINTFGMVDTNSDPTLVDFAIPANDDATKSIALITNYLVGAIREGLEERQAQKDQAEKDDQEVAAEEAVEEVVAETTEEAKAESTEETSKKVVRKTKK